MTLDGRILKGVGGLYHVQTSDGIIPCKARGVFRKDGIRPLPGDYVVIQGQDTGASAITEIKPRKNVLQRPPVANADKLIIISGAVKPAPNPLIIDRLTAIAADKDIEPIIAFSKSDLADVSSFAEIYRRAGFTSFVFSSLTGEGTEQFRTLFDGSVCVLTGNSGVGKSTLLNRLFPELSLETGEISEKLGRGRHTTRQVELFPLFGGYIADTPGFSSVDFENGVFISKEQLKHCFHEFAEYENQCKFTGCSHTVEKGCAVLEALQQGKIEPTRHESYCAMYAEVKDIPNWQIRKADGVPRRIGG